MALKLILRAFVILKFPLSSLRSASTEIWQPETFWWPRTTWWRSPTLAWPEESTRSTTTRKPPTWVAVVQRHIFRNHSDSRDFPVVEWCFPVANMWDSGITTLLLLFHSCKPKILSSYADLRGGIFPCYSWMYFPKCSAPSYGCCLKCKSGDQMFRPLTFWNCPSVKIKEPSRYLDC